MKPESFGYLNWLEKARIHMIPSLLIYLRDTLVLDINDQLPNSLPVPFIDSNQSSVKQTPHGSMWGCDPSCLPHVEFEPLTEP